MMVKKQEGTDAKLISPDIAGIAHAVDILRAGEVVVFPTETVYGLGADARSGAGVAQIFLRKGRPSFNPLIVHINSRVDAEIFSIFDSRARLVADTFWPGPLTLILPLRPGQTQIDPLVTAGLDTVAVRVPAHKIPRDLIAALGGAIAAPSANKSGTLSPTTPLHVMSSFGDDSPPIIAGGATRAGVESTILDLSVSNPVILRTGSITPDDLAPILGTIPAVVSDIYDETGRPKSPGLLLKHYAPRTKIRLRAIDVLPDEAVLAFGSTRFLGMRSNNLLRQERSGFVRDMIHPDRFRNLSETGDLVEAAANLFKMLHDLDGTNASCIAVMDIPSIGLGLAINDRLYRAAQST